jgi:hypothetical protein
MNWELIIPMLVENRMQILDPCYYILHRAILPLVAIMSIVAISVAKKLLQQVEWHRALVEVRWIFTFVWEVIFLNEFLLAQLSGSWLQSPDLSVYIFNVVVICKPSRSALPSSLPTSSLSPPDDLPSSSLLNRTPRPHSTS